MFFGLWNSDGTYKDTRHNIGELVVRLFAKKTKTKFSINKEGTYEETLIEIDGHSILLARPKVSMNNSGVAMRSILNQNDLNPNNICVIHDDIDLPFGRLRLKLGSSDGGHNGVKSINQELSSDSYYRLKLGLGRPRKGVNPADYVLSTFFDDEIEEANFLAMDSVEVLKAFIKDKEIAIKKASERRIIDVVLSLIV